MQSRVAGPRPTIVLKEDGTNAACMLGPSVTADVRNLLARSAGQLVATLHRPRLIGGGITMFLIALVHLLSRNACSAQRNATETQLHSSPRGLLLGAGLEPILSNPAGSQGRFLMQTPTGLQEGSTTPWSGTLVETFTSTHDAGGQGGLGHTLSDLAKSHPSPLWNVSFVSMIMITL